MPSAESPAQSSAQPAVAKRGRGRPRSESSRRAILRAMSDLLLERNFDKISMDRVAERAGVGKATIYRSWPSKERLAIDAVLSEWGGTGVDAPDRGTLTDDLHALILPWVRELRSRPYAGTVAALVAKAARERDFALEYRSHFVALRREPGRKVLQRAVVRGELPLDTDLEVALDLLYGPIYHRLLQGHAPLSDRFARTVVRYVVAGLAAAGASAR